MTLRVGLILLVSGCGNDPMSSPDLSVPGTEGCCGVIDGVRVTQKDNDDLLIHVDAARPPDLVFDLGVSDLATRTADMTTLIDAGPPPTVISHAQWSAFCQTFAACGLLGANVSACVNQPRSLGALPLEPASVLACISAAGNNCGAVKVCFADGSSNTACNGDTFAPTCSGNVYQACLGPGVSSSYAVDCTKLGLTCTAPTSSAPLQTYCGFGACDPSVVLDYCIANFATKCIHGDLSPVEDCRVFANEVCGILPTGQSACLGSGAACTLDRCAGNTLVSCKHGKEASYDCSLIGLTCVSPKGIPQCGLGIACDATYVETCVGNKKLTYCDAGVIATYDCDAAGWKTCVARAGDGSGGFCTP